MEATTAVCAPGERTAHGGASHVTLRHGHQSRP
jgi:hypothetical protein